MNKREVGFKYENVAKDYLILQGLVFVESNFYTRFGEIDLIFLRRVARRLCLWKLSIEEMTFLDWRLRW